MINKYNRQQERIFTLNDRGYRQAQRNDSHQMYFNLKTVKLKTLFQLGFKPMHLQFLVVNFAKSQSLPKVNSKILFTKILAKYQFID